MSNHTALVIAVLNAPETVDDHIRLINATIVILPLSKKVTLAHIINGGDYDSSKPEMKKPLLCMLQSRAI